MGKGTWKAPSQPLSSQIPGIAERPNGMPDTALPLILTVPLPLSTDAKTAASKAYLANVFTAPCDGCFLAKMYTSAVVPPDYASAVLAVEKYDASANAGSNALAATNFDMESLTAKEGAQLTLTSTESVRVLDEGDTINTTLTTGASEVAAGQGISVTLVIYIPEPNPQ